MSKKKKEIKGLERKINTLISLPQFKEFNYKQVAFSLGVSDTKGRNEIIKILNTYLKKEKIIKVGRGRFRAPSVQKELATGVLEITSTGRGYVVCEELEDDIMIEKKHLNKALHGDKVEVLVREKKYKNKHEGQVIKILKRNKTVFVGVFEKNKDYAFVNTRNARMYTDFFIDKEEMKNYKTGETVAVEIKKWENSSNSPEGRIVKTFGFENKEKDAYSILYEYGLSAEFEEEVEKEAKKINKKISKEEELSLIHI